MAESKRVSLKKVKAYAKVEDNEESQIGGIIRSRAASLDGTEDDGHDAAERLASDFLREARPAPDTGKIEIFRDTELSSPQPKKICGSRARGLLPVSPIFTLNQSTACESIGQPYSDEEVNKTIERLKFDGQYIHLGKQSISGGHAIDWRSSNEKPRISFWFKNLLARIRASLVNWAIDDALDVTYNSTYYTSNAGNAVRLIDEQLLVRLARQRKTIAGDYRIEFFGTNVNVKDVSKVFSEFYRGSTIEINSVASRLDVDHFIWLEFSDDEVITGASVQQLLVAVGSNSLVLRDRDFTIGELTIIRLMSNGLPRLAAPAENENVLLLDDTYCPYTNVFIISHRARPPIDVAVPTALDIATTIIKLATATCHLQDCYEGLVRAVVTSVRFYPGNHITAAVDGFLQHRRTIWARPIFRNPLIVWFDLFDNSQDTEYQAEINCFMNGSAEDIFYKIAVTAMTVATAVSTILHRWSLPSNIIQLCYNNQGFDHYAGVASFFMKRVNVSSHGRICNLMFLAAILIRDTCYEYLPAGGFEILRWNGAVTNPIVPLNDEEGWVAGWPRLIPYPVMPTAVLYIYKSWPALWGLLSAPVTMKLDNEIISHAYYVELTRGDDILMNAAARGVWFLSTAYTTALLNAISQHCRLDHWPQPELYITAADGSLAYTLADKDIAPPFTYIANSRLFLIGSIWHWSWYEFTPISVRWRRRNLPIIARSLFINNYRRTLTAGIDAA
ncbi:hypothetical protein GJ496_005167 [Pomphorhynchus laevis]|nr:hypothetical protein GJ496_005167 [Pomphorhynchus laevis]